MAPLSSSCLAFSISAAGPPAVWRTVFVELRLGVLGLLHIALGHSLVVGDQVDQHAEER
jgi:hypothetical protein